jgi:hypothetical protein
LLSSVNFLHDETSKVPASNRHDFFSIVFISYELY